MAACLFTGLDLASVSSLGHNDFPGVDFASHLSLEKPGMQGSVAMDYLSPKFIRRLSIRGETAGVDLNLLDATQTRWQGARETTKDWSFDRNDMFLGLMSDFMALAEGRPPSDTPLLPRLDRVLESASLIARAWEARAFKGEITGDFA